MRVCIGIFGLQSITSSNLRWIDHPQPQQRRHLGDSFVNFSAFISGTVVDKDFIGTLINDGKLCEFDQHLRASLINIYVHEDIGSVFYLLTLLSVRASSV